jgi:hypothetical protein
VAAIERIERQICAKGPGFSTSSACVAGYTAVRCEDAPVPGAAISIIERGFAAPFPLRLLPRFRWTDVESAAAVRQGQGSGRQMAALKSMSI